jgi:TolB-like protein/DNA-binding winged helix-turn-helix (wHTH) protein/Flp pilus assembly protein TadD
MSRQQRHLYEFGPFSLDMTDRFLLRDGQPVSLPPKALETLIVLVQHQGRLVEKDELMKTLWPDSYVEEANLNHHVWALRKMLGETSGGHRYIETVPRRGYRFVAGVTELPDDDDQLVVEKHSFSRIVTEEAEEKETGGIGDSRTGARSIEAVGTSAASTRAISSTEYVVNDIKHHKRAAFMVLSILVIAAAAFAYLKYSGSRPQTINSIAVLPFANTSNDPNMEYLSDGVGESLINRLSQLPQLKVIARSSSFKYKGKEIDPQEVAKELGVQALLMGRVVQRGDNLQISVELVNASEKTQMWGGQYNRKAADLQGVQEEISQTISEKLRLRLTGAQEQQLTKHATQNPQAYQLFLNGLYYLRKGGFENVRKALDYFNQAVGLDPSFALGWASVARSYRVLAVNSLLDPKESLAKARAATQKALELDETLAEAHWILAGIKQNEWDWAGAEREYRRAIALNPNLAEAHFRYSEYLSLMTRHKEALDETKRAYELDPLQDSLRTREAFTLYIARRYDEAVDMLQNAVKLNPDSIGAHNTLGFIYTAKGMSEQAVQEFQKGIRLQGETMSMQCYLGYALAKAGRRSEAKAILENVKATREYVSPTELAEFYTGLGDNEAAIASLERAYAAHDLQLQTLNVSPHFDTLRADSRFQELVRKVGLPQ